MKPDGSTFDYEYDILGRLTRVVYCESITLYTITYDAQGNIYSYYDSVNGVEYRYEYDNLGRLIRSFLYEDGERKQAFELQYDAIGRTVGHTSVIDGIGTIEESYTYYTESDSAPTGALKDYHNGNGGYLTLQYDSLGRVSGATYHPAAGNGYDRQIGYAGIGENQTSALPNRLTYSAGENNTWSDIQYTYDAVGNIIEINDGTYRYEYTYDALGQLTTESIFRNSSMPEYYYTYTYDQAGNIVSALNGERSFADLYTNTYTYGNADWGDQLTAFNNETITYNAYGNPTSYRGKALTWTFDQHLQRYDANSSAWIEYTYNRNGIRTSKNCFNMVRYDYALDGNRILSQKWLSNTMLFYYDENGAPQSVNYNGTLYTYVLNLQGDVIQIRDASGNLVAQYLYNAWGKVLKITDANGNNVTSGIGYENPLRYRGYYYDWESGFYYLNSRYYDPETCRFISADSYVATGTGILSNNMYAYCGNNSVNLVDHNGQAPFKVARYLLSYWISGDGKDLILNNYSFVSKALKRSKTMQIKIYEEIEKYILGKEYGKGTVVFNHDEPDLWLGIRRASYEMKIQKGTKTTGFWFFKKTKVRYTVAVKVYDIYNFNTGNESGDGIGSVLNNIGYWAQQHNLGKQYYWEANYVYKTNWM